MTLDKNAIATKLRAMAARMLPGWTYDLLFAASVDDIGALGMIEPFPERKYFKMWIAPHPPEESYDETLAHELTHGILSPLTHLLKPSAATVMIEEMIVEPLGCELAKIMTSMPGMTAAMLRAIRNPRTNAPALRKRISALATRRRNVERKRTMPDANKLAELAMKAGEMGGREDVPEDVRGLLQELVAALAGGGGAPESEPPMREDKPEDGKSEPPMREGDMPEAMRAQYRTAKRAGAMMLQDTIRLRLHTARTVDRLELDEATSADLTKATTIEQFEREFGLVKRMATKGSEQRRARSGVNPSESPNNGAPSIASLLEEGMAEPLARSIHRAYDNGKEDGDIALDNARKRLPKKAGA